MEIIPLPAHILIHFVLALLAGWLLGRYFKKVWLGVIAGFCGGFLIDLDHVLEYFLFFGWQFNLSHFLAGWQFLLSDRIYLWFHAWEYVVGLLILAWCLQKYRLVKIILITVALTGSLHLATDILINQYPLAHYSLIARARANFLAEGILSPEGYQAQRELRQDLGL